MVRFWLQYEPILRMSDVYELEQKYLVNGLYKTADELLQIKMKSYENLEESETQSKKPQIFIDQLFKRRSEFSYEEIKDECMTVIAAGFDTIAITMSFIVLILAMHQDVQEKAFQELQHVFNSNDEDVDEEKISQLTYLDLVIKETMRFWPTAPFFARLVTEDIEVGKLFKSNETKIFVTLGSHVVPAKSIILVPVNKIHRNKDYWGDDADEFKPERFNSESFRNVPTYAYVPFAKGPRNCIGGNYAMKAMKIALSYFLRNYKVTTDLKVEDITFELVITARIIQGCKVKIMKRVSPSL
ncbi:CLUMA_CG012617, isoform A [Clunio marinus]|uniref:CLUMA_CG012617, isoform A n=1 Tax=Clunio marinus TaxID=568069 RepID=A0A1J1IGA1_9DIPT|nr:CLUMA_CG012617, isoform A [Clunio marinus]